MAEKPLLQQVAQKGSDKEARANQIIKNPAELPEILNGMNSDRAPVRYGCAKILRIISEKAPEILYPRMDLFIKLLDSKNNIMKWEGIHVIANLAAADPDDRIERIIDKFFAPIPGPVMVTAANVIAGAAKIALAKPRLTERITREILKVEKAKYQTDECRNVAIGHAIKSFSQFFSQIEDKEPVKKFVMDQLENSRSGTRKAAENFVAKWLR